jgi:hypothetical protein
MVGLQRKHSHLHGLWAEKNKRKTFNKFRVPAAIRIGHFPIASHYQLWSVFVTSLLQITLHRSKVFYITIISHNFIQTIIEHKEAHFTHNTKSHYLR